MHSSTLTSSPPGEEVSLELDDGSRLSRPFFAGPENRLLVCALRDFRGVRGCAFNPLLLYGRPGIGKTHVALGVARRISRELGASRVVYVTGSDFASEYAEGIETHTIGAWRERIRSAQLLVIDGLDSLGSKRAAQIELLHALDEILARAGQVLATSRLAPLQMASLLPGLSSRLASGLSIEMALPGRAARIAAIEAAAKERGFRLGDMAARSLAEAAGGEATVGELHGLLCDVAAHVGGEGLIDVAAVRAHARRLPTRRGATMSEIARRTAKLYAMKVADLRGPSQRQSIVTARGVAMYLSRQLTSKSFKAIGSYFGGRDHTTVLHACQKVGDLMAADQTTRQSVNQLQQMLTSGGCLEV